jgi:catechol 2,3-dioxygenase-like lactoylglutathione lyase family enzyme
MGKAMIKTQGVVHFSLPVTDMERSAKFYSELLGMRIVRKTPRMVFLKCGEDFLILAKGNAPLKFDSDKNTPVHHAFRVAAEDFEPAVEFLRMNGVEVFDVENRQDGVFLGPQAYFLDPDGNKLEIDHVTGIGVNVE